jgi:hypothetical protein
MNFFFFKKKYYLKIRSISDILFIMLILFWSNKIYWFANMCRVHHFILGGKMDTCHIR